LFTCGKADTHRALFRQELLNFLPDHASRTKLDATHKMLSKIYTL
jgi:hypothetical protein